MPRKMPLGWLDLVARKDKQCESHTTLSLVIDNGDILRHYYFASARLTINGVIYEPQLRRSSSIKYSLTRSVDKGTVDLQNVDTELGKEFLALGLALYGAEMKIGRWMKDKISGGEYHKVLLTGPLISMKPDENAMKLTAVSEPYANISVGAVRTVTPSCGWLFRQPTTCGYAGSLLTCNLLINHADGCQGRHGDPLKRARFGGFSFINSGSRLKTV